MGETIEKKEERKVRSVREGEEREAEGDKLVSLLEPRRGRNGIQIKSVNSSGGSSGRRTKPPSWHVNCSAIEGANTRS